MKIPTLTLPSLPSLPDALAPLKKLPVLKMGLADLARARRAWPSVLPGAAASADSGALEEITSFGSNPGALRMFRFVPPGLPRGAPLVVVLHGCTQNAAGYDAGAGWSTLAARHGFAVLYPEQQRSNNHNTCFNWFEPGDTTRGQGEVASINAMIAATIASLGTNPARVFVTGLSAGGAMTSALLAAYPDVFAGGAIIAGLPYGAAHSVQEALGAMYHATAKPAAERGNAVRAASPKPQRKPVVSIWHGEADTTVVPANAIESAKQWCDVHGLTDADSRTDQVDGASHRAWHDARGTVQVELYTIKGMGHGTPIAPAAKDGRGVGAAMPHMLNVGISSTWHIARRWGLIRD